MVWAYILSMSGAMMNPFDFRDIMKAQMRYNETRTVQEVLDDHKARDSKDADGQVRVSKTPPEPGRAATRSELDAARALLGAAKPDNFAVVE